MLPLLHIGLHVKYLLFLSEFNKNVSTDFRKILKYQIHENPSSGSRVVPRRRTDGWTNRRTWRSQQLFFKISRKRLKCGPYRPYAQKSETHWKQGVTLVGRRQGTDNYKSHIGRRQGTDNYKSHISFSAAQQPNSVLRRLTLRFLDYTQHTHTHTAGLLWMSDQFVAEGATYTTHKIHNRRTSMLSAGFELAIPAIKPLQV